jgi:hypothetical protein
VKTRDQFIADYCERSWITRESFEAIFVALPCVCDYEDGVHWAAIRLDARQICDHLAFHSPTTQQLIDMGHEP